MIREALLYEKKGGNWVRCASAPTAAVSIPEGAAFAASAKTGREPFQPDFRGIARRKRRSDRENPSFIFCPVPDPLDRGGGCNFRCSFCQNHEISQMPREQGRIAGRERTATEIVAQAVRSGSKSIAYTYTEPTVFLEFILETAGMAKEKGLKNVFVTNGYMTPEALSRMAPCLDAANVDLKSFRDRFYREQCGARLEPVLDTLKRMKHLSGSPTTSFRAEPRALWQPPVAPFRSYGT